MHSPTTLEPPLQVLLRILNRDHPGLMLLLHQANTGVRNLPAGPFPRLLPQKRLVENPSGRPSAAAAAAGAAVLVLVTEARAAAAAAAAAVATALARPLVGKTPRHGLCEVIVSCARLVLRDLQGLIELLHQRRGVCAQPVALVVERGQRRAALDRLEEVSAVRRRHDGRRWRWTRGKRLVAWRSTVAHADASSSTSILMRWSQK